MEVLFNKIRKAQLRPGDHIYSWRRAYVYAHHGIYAGENKVIHFTRGVGQEAGTGTVADIIFSSSSPVGTGCTACGNQAMQHGVIMSCLSCFLADGDIYLFNYGVSVPFFLAQVRGGTCTLATSDPPDDVLYRAHSLLRDGFGVYAIFNNNCEDFAIYCKTGLLVTSHVGRSGQAASFFAASATVASSPFLRTNFIGPVVAGILYCISRLASDIGMRRDGVKVPVERLLGINCNAELVRRLQDLVGRTW